MRRLKSPGHAQRFLAAHGVIRAHFCFGRHCYGANGYRTIRQDRFVLWHTIPGVKQVISA